MMINTTVVYMRTCTACLAPSQAINKASIPKAACVQGETNLPCVLPPNNVMPCPPSSELAPSNTKLQGLAHGKHKALRKSNLQHTTKNTPELMDSTSLELELSKASAVSGAAAAGQAPENRR